MYPANVHSPSCCPQDALYSSQSGDATSSPVKTKNSAMQVVLITDVDERVVDFSTVHCISESAFATMTAESTLNTENTV